MYFQDTQYYNICINIIL